MLPVKARAHSKTPRTKLFRRTISSLLTVAKRCLHVRLANEAVRHLCLRLDELGIAVTFRASKSSSSHEHRTLGLSDILDAALFVLRHNEGNRGSGSPHPHGPNGDRGAHQRYGSIYRHL